MSVINWGIIGLGKIANEFASGFDQLKNSRLYSVASKNIENLEEFYNNIMTKYFEASNEYMSKYNNLTKKRSIEKMVEL